MKLPRDLSGQALAVAPCRRWGYVRIHQTGIILQTETPQAYRIAIPNHIALRVGTLHGILHDVAAAKGVDRKSILDSL